MRRLSQSRFPFRRLRSAAVLLALGTALTACSGGGVNNFDPSDLLDFMDTKKKLPGERKPVFPEGVPGLEQGVPRDLYRGNATPDMPEPAEAAAPPPEPPPRATRSRPKRAAQPPRAPRRAAPAAPPAEEAAPAPPPQQPPPPPPSPPAGSSPPPFPAPLPSGGFSR